MPGKDPSAVGQYLLDLVACDQIPTGPITKRNLLLGYGDDGQPFSLAIRGRNLLVAGDTKSGKSWVTGLLCEQLILHGYSLFILDPEGDYTTLEKLPGVMVFGGLDPLPRPRDLVRAFRHADVSVIVDLSHTPYAQKIDFCGTALAAVATLRRQTGLPHRIIVDEAHYLLRDSEIAKQIEFTEGGFTLATYRTSQLHPEILRSTNVIIVTRESDPEEIRYLHSFCESDQGDCGIENWEKLLGSLEVGDAVALPLTAEAKGLAKRIHLVLRLTPHARHFGKYVDIPVPEQCAFVFWRDNSATGTKARTLREFVAVLDRWPVAALAGHLRRHDFSQWIGKTFGDYPLSREIYSLEQDYAAGRGTAIEDGLVRAIRSRYELLSPDGMMACQPSA